MRFFVPLSSLTCVIALGACQRPDVRFPQFVRDSIVVDAVWFGIAQINDDNLTGTPTGPKAIDASCPLGGSAGIIGFADVDSVELTYALQSCTVGYASGDQRDYARLSLTGELTFAGYAGGTPQRTIQDFHAANLSLVGEIRYDAETIAIDDTCAVSIFVDAGSVSIAVSAKLCDRDVTSSLAHQACL